jgi:hypothetical protein
VLTKKGQAARYKLSRRGVQYLQSGDPRRL